MKKLLLPLTATLLFLTAIAPQVAAEPTASEKALWVGAFDQCSFDALGAVLNHYRSATPAFTDRIAFEKETFNQALDSTGMGAYFGWAPWTSYIVNSGKLSWTGGIVTEIHGENFSLSTTALPTVHGQKIQVSYAPNERVTLCERLRARLREGPVVLWVPYCAALSRQVGLPGDPWKTLRTREAPDVDTVSFSPNMTHSVTIFARAAQTDPVEEALVMDCSVKNGIFITDIDTLVTIAAAMRASIRIPSRDDGSSIYSRGLKGIDNEAYEVAFHRDAPPTQPASQPATHSAATSSEDPAVSAALTTVLQPYLADVRRALSDAGPHRQQWLDALAEVPPEERPGLDSLLAGMSSDDLQHLDKQFVLEDLRQSYAARAASPWATEIPDDLFLANVIPYANVTEKREPWRAHLGTIAAPLIIGRHTPGDAALALNEKLFKQVQVQYHPTKRPKPDQSPAESIAAGYASCTGLSILLVDACRSVNIPARIVATPSWVLPRGDVNGNHAGNHTWVEIWDKRWHILGASEVSPLDHTWFLDNARLAIQSTDPLHHIYAAVWARTGTHLPMVWAPDDASVSAEDVTLRYAPP